ncbi:MAG: type III secretion system needle filament subunit SctF [Candidatus Symbiodolus clandestinus]
MDLSGIIENLTELTEEAVKAVKEVMADLNKEGGFNDPAVTLKAQFAVDQYSHFISYQGSIIKIFRDLMAGVISKI